MRKKLLNIFNKLPEKVQNQISPKLAAEYNMGGMVKREIIGPDMLHTKMGHVMHFNGIPGKKEEVVPYWIEKTYKYLYEN